MAGENLTRKAAGGQVVGPHSQLTGEIIFAAITVHKALGPGLLESAYEACLAFELDAAGLACLRQVPIPITYRGVELDCGYRADLVVEDTVLVELKAVEQLLPLHEAQLLSYLRLGGWRVGLLMNFNVERLRQGIRRRVV